MLQTPEGSPLVLGSEVKNSIDDIMIDISGEVVKPGVYKLPKESRVQDVITASGGFLESADKNWIDKYLNKAAKLVDGQKIYIPNKQTQVPTANTSSNNSSVAQSNTSSDSNLANINTASLKVLEDLPGIGQTYGQKIIDHRPYSDVNELLSKQVLKQSVFDKIKDRITIY